MPKAATPAAIRFKPRLQRPAEPAGADWTFFVLTRAASARLPTRSQVSVEGTLGGQPFQATLEPDGDGGHWLKVEPALAKAAGVAAGDSVAVELVPLAKEPEPKVPDDLRTALAAHPAAKATWDDITALARRDWIQWVTSGKKAETRSRRIDVACDKLAKGQRRACCFDRSGMYSNTLKAPEAAK
jgi:hypothetical protein